jgi:hypothetical protein
MKQFVVAMCVLVAFFVGGPWFADKVGPGLADLITEAASPESPCPSATPTAAGRPGQARQARHPHHRARPHRQHKPHAPRPSASASPASPAASCAPAAGGLD